MDNSNVNNLENTNIAENVTEVKLNLKNNEDINVTWHTHKDDEKITDKNINDKKEKKVKIQISEEDEKIIEKNNNVCNKTISKNHKNIVEEKKIEINLNEKLPPSFYEIYPDIPEKFRVEDVKRSIRRILVEHLKDKNYSYEIVSVLIKKISEDVNQAVCKLNMRHYKHAVQVVIGQELGAGCHYVARCRWDAECDTQVSDVYTNSTLFCVCTVFGVYLY